MYGKDAKPHLYQRSKSLLSLSSKCLHHMYEGVLKARASEQFRTISLQDWSQRLGCYSNNKIYVVADFIFNWTSLFDGPTWGIIYSGKVFHARNVYFIGLTLSRKDQRFHGFMVPTRMEWSKIKVLIVVVALNAGK